VQKLVRYTWQDNRLGLLSIEGAKRPRAAKHQTVNVARSRVLQF